MKVYLDDMRECPWPLAWWVHSKTAEEAIDLLKTGEITEIDLDHDLGTSLTGHDVLVWIEKEFYTNPDFKLPKIRIHTNNPYAHKAMMMCVKRLEKARIERKNI